jgi:TPR repeat protein
MNKLIVSLLLASTMCTATAGPFEDGDAAYKRGDYATALKHWQPLADQGNAAAQNNLGVMYDLGRGVPQDYAEAMRWYKLAAAQGDAKAQYNLGAYYGNGQGVPQDNVKAHIWLNLAAAKGESAAAMYRDIVAKKMTPQQITTAQKLARDCLARNFQNCD